MTHSLEAEKSVLGSMFTYGAAAVKAVQDEGLQPEHFWWDTHVGLAKACFDLHEKGLPVDDITVARMIEGTSIERADLDSCFQYMRPSSLREHARFVIEDHGWRMRFRQAEELMNAVKTRNEAAWQRIIAGDKPALRVVKGEAA